MSSSSDSEPSQGLKWPHENLGSRYNNFGRTEVKYRSLDVRLLSAGEINICSMSDVSDKERKARLNLLGDVLFNSAFYQWHAILRFHAAVLGEIECGNMQWGDDYHRLEQQMLMPYPLSKSKNEKQGERSGRGKGSSYSGKNSGDDRVVFCADYQKKTCSYNDTHQGWFFGNKVTLHHICSSCLKVANQKVRHPL